MSNEDTERARCLRILRVYEDAFRRRWAAKGIDAARDLASAELLQDIAEHVASDLNPDQVRAALWLREHPSGKREPGAPDSKRPTGQA